MARRILQLGTLKHLAFALHMPLDELERLLRSLHRSERRHYQQWSKRKPDGRKRMITPPNSWLKSVQRRLNASFQTLDMPDSIHGGRRGRSPFTNAEPHRFAGELVVTDIEDCFPSISSGQVYAMFRERQLCTPDVARALARLTTFQGALPQGAPTSPMVAALVMTPLMQRVDALAGIRSGRASLYVDDLTVSGTGQPRRTCEKLTQIVKSEGLRPHLQKTHVISDPARRNVTGIRVGSGSRDVERDVLNELDSMIEAIASADDLDGEAVARAEGLIQHASRLNRGAAKLRKRRLTRVITSHPRSSS